MDQKILIVDDEKKIRAILSRILSDEGFTVKAVESGEEALDAVDTLEAPIRDPSVINMRHEWNRTIKNNNKSFVNQY